MNTWALLTLLTVTVFCLVTTTVALYRLVSYTRDLSRKIDRLADPRPLPGETSLTTEVMELELGRGNRDDR